MSRKRRASVCQVRYNTNVTGRAAFFCATIALMELKRLVSQFAYKIEPNGDGGFIARATDPSVPPIEAPTREELQQKIQQRVLDGLSAEFPQLKSAIEGKKLEMAFHVERTPQGGFEIHSADPNSPVISAANEHDLQSHFLEKMLNFAGKHIVPELSAALAAQVGSGNVKVTVNKRVLFKVGAGPRGMLSTSQRSEIGVPAGEAAKFPQVKPEAAVLMGTIDNQPITPESNSNWKVVGLAFVILILSVLMYLFFHLR